MYHSAAPVYLAVYHATPVCLSVALFESYVDQTDPVWISWVKHIEYLDLLFAHEITAQELIELENKIFVAQQAFDTVREFKGLYKPKHHFLSHACIHIMRLGPMRGYWCYSFEGFHQRIKRICRNSNYKYVSGRLVDFWIMQFRICMSIADPAERRRMVNLC